MATRVCASACTALSLASTPAGLNSSDSACASGSIAAASPLSIRSYNCSALASAPSSPGVARRNSRSRFAAA